MIVGMVCLAFFAGRAAFGATGVVNVLDHGAVGDGTTLNTAALQKAIDACAQQKGGTVLVPAGVFRTGPIQLQSNVTLQLEAGAVLRASEAIADYRAGGRVRPLISARDAMNVTICGRGTIDGRGTAFMNLDQVRTSAGRLRATVHASGRGVHVAQVRDRRRAGDVSAPAEPAASRSMAAGMCGSAMSRWPMPPSGRFIWATASGSMSAGSRS